jgi:hypothetical protein
MCSMTLKKSTNILMKSCETSEPKFKLFGVSVRYNVNTGTPHKIIERKCVFILYGAFRYYSDKNMSQSAMTLIAERHTPRFCKLNH